jgi:hypothetical protein
MIPPPLAAFLQEGLGIHITTRNGALEPKGARALAVSVDPDGAHVTVYVAAIAARRLMPDLLANGQAAVGFARPIDERACQVKGAFVGARDAQADEERFVRTQWEGFLRNLNMIGIPREPIANWSVWPASAIRLKVTAIFDQTPGPGAGEPLP